MDIEWTAVWVGIHNVMHVPVYLPPSSHIKRLCVCVFWFRLLNNPHSGIVTQSSRSNITSCLKDLAFEGLSAYKVSSPRHRQGLVINSTVTSVRQEKLFWCHARSGSFHTAAKSQKDDWMRCIFFFVFFQILPATETQSRKVEKDTITNLTNLLQVVSAGRQQARSTPKRPNLLLKKNSARRMTACLILILCIFHIRK